MIESREDVISDILVALYIYINRERERGLESCKDLNVKRIEINVTF